MSIPTPAWWRGLPPAPALSAAALLLLGVFGPLAHAQLPTITVEAEHYSEVTGGTIRVLDRADASGGKCVSYWEEPGVAVRVEFEVEQAGEYCLTLKYACAWEDTRRQIAVDGQVPPGLDVVTLLGTGSWDAFDVMTLAGQDGGRLRLDLDAGKHALTLTNVDSRGLAWDYALLHDPMQMPADFPLSEAELRALASELPAPAARLLLDGPGPDDLLLGDVAAAFTDDGALAAFRIGDLFLALLDPVVGSGVREEREVGALKLRTQVLPREMIRNGRWVLMVSERSLYLIGVALSDYGSECAPAPLVQWRDGQPWAISPAAHLADAAERNARMFGDALISATSPLTAALSPSHPPFLRLTWQPLCAGRLRAVGLKIGPRIAPGDSTIAAEVQGNEIIIRSSKEMYPALAAFYEMPQFGCRVSADGSMTITAQGEELTLRAP